MALRVMVEEVHVLPQRVVLLSWHVEDAPLAPARETAVTIETFGQRHQGVIGVDVVLGYRKRLKYETSSAAPVSTNPRPSPTLIRTAPPTICQIPSLGCLTWAAWLVGGSGCSSCWTDCRRPGRSTPAAASPLDRDRPSRSPVIERSRDQRVVKLA